MLADRGKCEIRDAILGRLVQGHILGDIASRGGLARGRRRGTEERHSEKGISSAFFELLAEIKLLMGNSE